jgi:hypothetical protein
MTTTDYAILIGIDRYPRLPEYEQLSGAENDARHMCNWLIAPDGGNLHPGNVRLICSSDYPTTGNTLYMRPIKDDIATVFQKLIHQSSGKRLGRRLYFFLSGHGLSPGDARNVGLIMADYQPPWWSRSYFPGSRCADWLRTRVLFDEIVLFMDCCRDFKDQYPNPPDIFWAGTPIRSSSARHFYGFATRWGSKAYENPESRSGRFTDTLLKGLQGGARNSLGQITGATLTRFLRDRMQHGSMLQHPSFDYDPGDDIVLVEGIATHAQVRITFTVPAGTLVEILNDALQPIAHHTVQSGTEAQTSPWNISLSPGLYLIKDQQQSPSTGRPFSVTEEKIDVEF